MKYHAPLDPDCPTVNDFMSSLFDDPMTEAMGAPTDDICEDFERKHRVKCKRCQEFGASNIEVVHKRNRLKLVCKVGQLALMSSPRR